MTIFDEALHPRGQAGNAGQFRAKQNDAPTEPLDPRAELDAVNSQYHANTDQVIKEVGLYLESGMPESAHRVEFEQSDQGDYVHAARAFDVDGTEIDLEEDYDRWADVNSIVSLLGYPDDNRVTFRNLFTQGPRGVFTWNRTQPTTAEAEAAIRGRIDALTETRRGLAQGSQAAAIVAIRRMLPEGAKATLTWGDQGGPDYLTVETITLADGTGIDWENADELDVDWDEIDMAASDVRDAGDPALRPLDSEGVYFELSQHGE